MKPPLRTKSVGTKVSEEDFADLESRARARAELLEPVRDGIELDDAGLARARLTFSPA